ncbi:MAG: Gfo/Idh/MocA family oxidoreductase [Candidatus Riflebacteria bacterium]|nr:Gfo/Idh/MocA family oxidoreductase [Candidatus Riflebacteria bacterium]
MKIFAGEKWEDGFIDHYRNAGECRIEVIACRTLERIEGMYFVRQKSLRLLVNYLFEIGPRQVLRKVRSRAGETLRNDKYVSCGIGRLLEGFAESSIPRGSLVAFLAPFHPACAERFVIPTELMRLLDAEHLRKIAGALEAGQDSSRTEYDIRFADLISFSAPEKKFWKLLTGYTIHSGGILSPSQTNSAMEEVLRVVIDTDWSHARKLPAIFHSKKNVTSDGILEIRPGPATNPPKGASAKPRPSGIVFGYGNYAKTFVIPNAAPFIDITGVHEIDPTQIPGSSDTSFSWDTSPLPRPEESADVFFAAGYHHTHVPIAIAALKRGGYAVVEKPIAVDSIQLNELLETLENSGPKLFSCYHKRYIPFNAWAREDLGVVRGEPISSSCIVYEVPLPPLHWYHWANSKSRLVSNGCHWLDHFLFMNDFAPVRKFDLTLAPDGTTNVSVTLENDAFMTLVLTDRGSERLGVRDFIELRSKCATVRMIDGGNYLSENSSRIVRRRSINKLDSYVHMYRTISARIAAGEAGDSVDSVRISAGLILALENRFNELAISSTK